MNNNPRCLYNNIFDKFINEDANAILGELCDRYHGNALTTTIEAWKNEITIMQDVISQLEDYDGKIIFEYDIPRLGKRVDVVLLLNGIIFCLEFKNGEKNILENDIDQVLDYALDLKNFHKLSEDKIIVPVLIATEYKNHTDIIQMSIYDDKVVNPLVTGKTGLLEVLSKMLFRYPNESKVDDNWIISPYAPTPTIIEAARSLYENHSVENITRHEADKVSTDRTISYILKVIKDSKTNGEKSICFVTGVPGAGKTLVGLDVAIKQTYQGQDVPVEDEGAVYLSGNGPLVAVLTEALAQDNRKKCIASGEKKKLTDSRRDVGKSIQMIHRYRDNMLAKIKNPVENGILEIDPEKAIKLEKSGFGEVEHVAIFDEAQRSWTHKRLADYLKRGGTYGNKLKVPNFPMSEAEFLIWSLDQREDWATIVCLVGGGQEINTGEAGISEWINALNHTFPDWEVYISPKLTEAEYVALMQASANEETICSSPASNNSNKVPEGETRGWTFTFSPTSHSDALDYSLTKRVSPIYQNATSVSVTATSSFERMVTNSGGLTFTTQVKSVVDATVEAQYSYAVSASSSTSSSVTGTFTPSGNKPYCAVLFTPHIATISGVVTETLSAMGSGSTTTYNCTLKYPVSVNHFLDGLYRLSESNNSEGFPPAA